MRLRQATPERNNEPFGGKSVIFFSDFGQLPPVLDVPMYVNKTTQNANSNDRIGAYKEFKEVYKLDVVQQQSKNNRHSEIYFKVT